MTRETVTYSMLSMFKSCRRKCQLRYKKNIVPIQTPKAFLFGKAIHAALEEWYRGFYTPDFETAKYFALKEIERTGLDTQDMIKAKALFDQYIEFYNDQDLFEVIFIEREFSQPIRSQKGAKSRFFELRGKIDGLIKWKEGTPYAGKYFILEHKTASNVDDSYKMRAQFDNQIALYAMAIQDEFCIPISGAIYNVIEKPLIRMKQGESEAEFEARRAEQIAKSKTGKTSIKRNFPESEEEFYNRCVESIKAKDHFHRIIVEFDPADLDEVKADVWQVCQDYKSCCKSNSFYNNTQNCMNHGVPCEYMQICHSLHTKDPKDTDGLFTTRDAHEELSSQTPPPIIICGENGCEYIRMPF